MNLRRLINKCPAWMFTIIVTIAVLYLTLVPKPLPDMDIPLFPGADKVVHAIMMLGVMWCIGLDIMRHPEHGSIRPSKYRLFAALAITIAFGGAIELLQGAMKIGRGEDIYDFLADVTGAIIGYVVLIIVWEPLARWLQDE